MDILACSDPVVKMTVWQITDTIFSIFALVVTYYLFFVKET